MKIIKHILFFCFPPQITERDIQRLPKAQFSPYPRIYSLYNYQNPKVKKLIRHLKKHREPSLKKIIGSEMCDYLLPILAEYETFHEFREPFVIPMPISRKRKKERGFNQCDDMARYLADTLPRARYQKNLIRKKESQKQALIKNRQERKRNVQNVFSLKNQEGIKNQDVIIVDDLVTTGATLQSLFSLLKKAGARNVLAITIAH